MKIHILAVSSRQPSWVEEGFLEFQRRMPPACRVELIQIPLARRGRNPDSGRAKADEGQRLLVRVPEGSRIIALDERGDGWTTVKLSRRLADWFNDGRDVALLIGGPDGLADICRQRAEAAWSLSSSTLPHGLVRIIVAEQLYRAWTVLEGHPYHRA